VAPATRTLRDATTCCYRVDRPTIRALVVEADGAGDLLAVAVATSDASARVGTGDVTIDWNGAPVTETRPATVGAVAAGTPVVVLARAHGRVAGPVVVRARVGRETRSVTLARDDAIPLTGLGALTQLWA
jgi:hypothetical protein